jgi:serine phosphatase RsbU (regulator of sigma subunit)
MKKILFLLLFWTFSLSLIAQDYLVVTVKENDGSPIANAGVSLGDGEVYKTNQIGKVQIAYPKSRQKPTNIEVVVRGFEFKFSNYKHEARKLGIIMNPTIPFVKGKIVNQRGLAIYGAKISLANSTSRGTVSNEKGFFRFESPSGSKVDGNLVFLVNGSEFGNSNYKFNTDRAYFTVKVDKLNNNLVKKEDVKSTFLIKVHTSDKKKLSNIEVAIDGKSYFTSGNGTFEIEKNISQKQKFEIKGYKINRIYIEDKSKEATLYLEIDTTKEKTKSEENSIPFNNEKLVSRLDAIDSMIVNDEKDFNYIINELEIEKQQLTENSFKIRQEMERIATSLSGQEGDELQIKRQKALKRYLHRLETSFIENELAYQRAREKTKYIIEEMKQTIWTEDSLKLLAEHELLKVEGEKEEVEAEKARNILISIVIVSILILIVLGGSWAANRMRMQRNQLVATKNQLADKVEEVHTQKEQIELSLNNIQTISTIGQKITATLELDRLIQTVHKEVNSLIDASVFGVGIAHEQTRTIEFKDYMEKGTVHPQFSQAMDDDTKFAAWCLKNKEIVAINDLTVDYKKYLNLEEFIVPQGAPQSLIYLPLIVENKAIGIVTVQSYQKDAYTNNDITVLQALGSYIAVALANTRAYEVITLKNKKITDSIRYAQTIQEAILPNEEFLDTKLEDYFMIFRPKDIVSGDFYWFAEVKGENGEPDKTFIAVVDCTGHGVPGAFMSMIGHGLLNEIILQNGIHDTDKILTLLDQGVVSALKQEEKSNDDGMDICLCSFEKQDENSFKLYFTGAKRPLYYVNDQSTDLQTLKGDRKSVGGKRKKGKIFTKEELTLQKGDVIYLSTDGLVDQNSPNKTKFGSQRLKDILSQNAHLTLDEQEKIITETLEEHQKGGEQRDDISVMGIRL